LSASKVHTLANLDYFVENLHTVPPSSVCGALYEFPFDSLEDFRQVRTHALTLLNEKELSDILIGSAAGLGYLQFRNVQHGGVRSNNIYFERISRIKVACPTVKELESNYDLFKEKSSGAYLSPNELRSLKEGLKVPIHNSYKSDVFALGLVIL
jgi:serine/threonine protein kinase